MSLLTRRRWLAGWPALAFVARITMFCRYLYSGSSSSSLNHNTMNTASSLSMGVMSQGSSACFASTPCTEVIGTGKFTTRRQLINYSERVGHLLWLDGWLGGQQAEAEEVHGGWGQSGLLNWYLFSAGEELSSRDKGAFGKSSPGAASRNGPIELSFKSQQNFLFCC